jgi:hypothetical protein
MQLKHDAAPLHFSRAAIEFLNEGYEGKWTGRSGLMAWPTWSPDLKPLHFFLWSCMKLKAYHAGKPEARHQ